MNRMIAFLLVLLGCTVSSFAQTDQPTVYITYGFNGPNKVKLVDAKNFKEITSIPIADFPETITITPDNRVGFITHEARLRTGLSVIDLVNQRFIRSMFNGIPVTGVQIGPDGMAYVLLAVPSQIAVINPQTLNVLRMIPLPGRPNTIVFTPGGRLAYIDSLTASEIYVLDLSSNSIIRAIGNFPKRFGGENALILSPDGRFLYFTLPGEIGVIDTFNLTLVDRLPGTGDPFNLQISPDGNTLYVVDLSAAGFRENLSIVDIPSKTILKKFNEFGTGVSYIKLSQDGRALYINDGSQGGALHVLSTTTNSIITRRFHNEASSSREITLSNSFISIPPAVSVISPAPNEIIQRGRPFTIRWQTTATQYITATHRVELSLDGGNTYSTIVPNLSAQAQEFEFIPSNNIVSNARIRVTATDISAGAGVGESGTFSIGDRPAGDNEAPSVRFLNPLGGERFVSGDTVMITWASADNVAVTAQDLSLSTDGGSTFPMVIASGLAGAVQSFSFTIPSALQTPNARLRLAVRDAAGNRAEATTPGNFSISAPADLQAPVVTINSPTAGQVFPAGQPITANWRSVDNAGVASQALLLSLDGGASFQTVATFGADTASFTLNLPELERTVPRAQMKIMASDAAGNTGERTAAFTLAPMITMASYAKPVLSISGVGFNSINSQVQVRVMVNGREVAATVQSNTSINVRGNKRKLGLVRGSNTVAVIVDGVMSNSQTFQF